MEIIELNGQAQKNELKKHFIPIYPRKFACGLFGISEDFAQSYLSLDEKFLKNKESIFYARASGDSMNPQIYDGDILVIDRSLDVAQKSIVTLFYNNHPMCKMVEKIKDKVFLTSLNAKYGPIEVKCLEELDFFGVVIGVVRDFR